MGTPDTDYRVSLRNSTNATEQITFAATPDLIETRNVNYKTIDPIHAPGQIAAYGSTSSRNFNISNIRLISRNSDEAATNLQYLWLLRSWTMPNFGNSTLTKQQQQTRDLRTSIRDTNNPRSLKAREARGENGHEEFLRNFDILNEGNFGNNQIGAPPAVLLLSAYSATSNHRNNQIAGHISRVPVVIQNISIPYPSDIDYIPAAGSNTPMPTILTIDMTLMETHSPKEYETFDLLDFKSGNLTGF